LDTTGNLFLKWARQPRRDGVKLTVDRFILEPTGDGNGAYSVNYRVTNSATGETVIVEDSDTPMPAAQAVENYRALGIAADPQVLRPPFSPKLDTFLSYLAGKGVTATYDAEKGRYELSRAGSLFGKKVDGKRGLRGDPRTTLLYAPQQDGDHGFEKNAWVGMKIACEALDLPLPRDIDPAETRDYAQADSVTDWINNNNNNNATVASEEESLTGDLHWYDTQRDPYEPGSRDNPVIVAAEDRDGGAIRPSEAVRVVENFRVALPMPVAANPRGVSFGQHRKASRGLGDGIGAAMRFARERAGPSREPTLETADTVEMDWLSRVVDDHHDDIGDGEHQTLYEFHSTYEDEHPGEFEDDRDREDKDKDPGGR
jgi:hypothetical protein